MNLSDIFDAIAHKEFVTVDLPDSRSNQHELNGVAALRAFFGTEKESQGKLSWYYFADDQDVFREENKFTFYDARAKSSAQTGRSEWRFYYHGNFPALAGVDDLLVLARTQSGRYYGLIFQKNSAWYRAAKILFGLHGLQQDFDLLSRKKRWRGIISHYFNSRLFGKWSLISSFPPFPPMSK